MLLENMLVICDVIVLGMLVLFVVVNSEVWMVLLFRVIWVCSGVVLV